MKIFMSPISQEPVFPSHLLIPYLYSGLLQNPSVLSVCLDMDRSLSSVAHVQCLPSRLPAACGQVCSLHTIFRRTGFQAYREGVLNPLVKADSSHVLVGVCQNVALKQDEVMAPGMKPGSPWAYTHPEQLL